MHPVDLDDDEKRAIIARILAERARAEGPRPRAAASSAEDWASDLVLDDDIRPGARVAGAPPRACLLTGATGYLGAFVLADLCRRTPMKVHCLVRAADAAGAIARLRDKLEELGLHREVDLRRVVPIPGDLAAPYFGIGEAAFRDLAASVDSVFHLAAMVNFLFSYRDMRETNVGGTRTLLRFAGTGRAKVVHYVSTYGVFLTPRYSGALVSDDEIPKEPPAGGYAESKWVAERLVHKARRRGFDVRVYRPPFVGWDMEGRAFNQQDFVVRLVLGSMRLGSAPDLPLVFHVTPADDVSRAIVEIARGDVRRVHHNLVLPEGLRWAEVTAALAMRAPRLSRIPYAQWRVEVARDPGNPMRALSPALPRQEDGGEATYLDLLAESRVPAGFSPARLADGRPALRGIPSVVDYVHRLVERATYSAASDVFRIRDAAAKAAHS